METQFKVSFAAAGVIAVAQISAFRPQAVIAAPTGTTIAEWCASMLDGQASWIRDDVGDNNNNDIGDSWACANAYQGNDSALEAAGMDAAVFNQLPSGFVGVDSFSFGGNGWWCRQNQYSNGSIVMDVVYCNDAFDWGVPYWYGYYGCC